MAESNFVDYVKIYCRSGKGGRGSTHMRREKYCPNGGPDGGDGGRGGHIILRGNRNYWTLLHLKYDRHAMAGHGESGSKGRSFGKDGADKIIEVPCRKWSCSKAAAAVRVTGISRRPPVRLRVLRSQENRCRK